MLEGRQLAMLRLSEVGDHAYSELYHTLLEPSFPPGELATFDELDDARRSEDCDGLVLLDAEQPVAVMVTEDYLGGRVRLLAYLAVAEGMRGRALGEHLLSTLTGDPEQPLVLAEIEDPRFHADYGSSDPTARVRFYARRGWRLLPLDYFQPSLRPGSPRVGHLLLISFGPRAEYLDGELIADFLEEYFRVCEGDAVSDDDDFRALLSAARGGGTGPLPLYPLADLTRARPDPDMAAEHG